MPDSDDQLKPIPVAEFEGEFVRSFEAKLPAITLDMPEGYRRGMHLVLEAEVRVRGATYDETKRGDLVRKHVLVLEEVRLKEAFDPAARPNNVGGNVAGNAWEDAFLNFVHGDTDELDFDGEEIPERLRHMLKVYFEDIEADKNAPWHDPTHGQIDRDIQQAVDEMNPSSLGQRVAIERTLQNKRDSGIEVDF